MEKPSLYAFYLLLICLYSTGSGAYEPTTSYVQLATFESLVALSKKKNLANTRGWHNLIHYRNRQFWGPKQSQADDPDFFLSPNGVHSPEDELIATLHAFTNPEVTEEHAICRFPARFSWIQSQLDLRKENFPQPSCDALQTWLKELNTHSVSLIFASSYLNSPSSMFGHTFLRLDQPDQGKDNLLLANTISYAADAVEQDSEFMFAYRGIFGGYPGITSVTPYYDKIKVYTNLENRDIWEYELNLNPDEVRQLQRHAWEIKQMNFDYFFFDENCAYRILALIDVARPGTHLIDEFPLRAIPSDTVRAVVQKNLHAKITYRPSSATQLRHHLNSLTENEQSQLKDIISGRIDISTWVEQQKDLTRTVRILDAAYEYSRYLSDKEKLENREAAKLSYSLLASRSRLPATAPLAPPKEPTIRDDEGHETLRLSLSTGSREHAPYLEFGIRPAYHELLDPQPGYRAGSQLTFLDSRVRYYYEKKSIQLESLTAIGITSLSNIDSFFQGLSWNVSTGGERIYSTSDKATFAPYLQGGAGGAVQFFGQAYAFLNGRLEIGDHSAKGFNLGPQIHTGWLRQSTFDATHVELSYTQFLEGGQRKDAHIAFDQRFFLSDTIAVGARWRRQLLYQRYQTEWSFNIHSYF